MTRPCLGRRAFMAHLLAGAAAMWAADARAEVVKIEDRGLGGTGAAPTDGGEERGGGDRGIGGTGVVGTIRRFGSIVVNDLRIAYPAGVAVTIDGRAATPADLRLGHVVEVLAERRSGRLSTRRIAVAHEVVGPVEAVEGGGLRVLGQAVALWEGAEADAWHAGDVVAVSGLRRLDGVIAASLIEPHDGAELRVAGTVEAGPGGTLRVGGLQLADLPARFVGARVVLRGRMRDEALAVADVALAGSALLARRPKRLSVESYVERRGAGLRLGAGFAVAGLPGGRALPEGRAVRAVVTARLGAGGDLRVEAVRIEERGHGGGRGGAGRGFGPGAPGRPGFGPPGGLPGGGPSGGGLPGGGPLGGGPPGGFGGGGPPGGFGGGRGPGGTGGMGGRR